MKEPQPYGGFKCCTVLLHSALSMPKPIISKKDLDKGRRNRGEINCQHTLCFQISCHFLLMSKIHVRQVGSEVARRGIGLGFERVIAYDPYASEVKAQALGVKLVSWEEALAQGDFFSLHMPMTPQTKARSLCCPPHACLRCCSCSWWRSLSIAGGNILRLHGCSHGPGAVSDRTTSP